MRYIIAHKYFAEAAVIAIVAVTLIAFVFVSNKPRVPAISAANLSQSEAKLSSSGGAAVASSALGYNPCESHMANSTPVLIGCPR